jgi:hypothetical protein
MHTHDPFQTQLLMGAYSGATNPFGSPYAGLQTTGAISPFGQTQFGQPQFGQPPFGQQGYAGVPNLGAIAQQQQLQQLQQQLQQQQHLQQLASILGSHGVNQPLFGMVTHASPWQQNPLVAQNPLLNPAIAQQLALQGGLPYGQWPQLGQSPYGPSWSTYPQTSQIGSQFGQQPIGQGGFQPGYQLAPQSWVGQPGIFGGAQQLAAQIYPHQLAQLAARGLIQGF